MIDGDVIDGVMIDGETGYGTVDPGPVAGNNPQPGR